MSDTDDEIKIGIVGVSTVLDLDEKPITKLVILAIAEGAATAREVAEMTKTNLRTIEKHYSRARIVLRSMAYHTRDCVSPQSVKYASERSLSTSDSVTVPSHAPASITTHANIESSSKILVSKKEDSPLPPEGGGAASPGDPFGFQNQTSNSDIFLNDDGSIEMINGSRSKAIEMFNGDSVALDLALIEIANGRNERTREPIEKTVWRRLAWMVREERGKNERYDRGRRDRAEQKKAEPPKLNRMQQAQGDAFEILEQMKKDQSNG